MNEGAVSSFRWALLGVFVGDAVIEGVKNRRVLARSPGGRPFAPSAARRLTATAAVD
jgi:hypothetical protein